MADFDFKNLMKDYYRTLEDADEKVHLANHMYDFVERYLRRLDTELYKFKCELEADHSGITTVLEKRSLELDAPQSGGVGGVTSSSSGGTQVQKENRYRPRVEKRRDSSISNNHETKRLATTQNVVTTPSALSSALTAPIQADVRHGVVIPPVPNNNQVTSQTSAISVALQSNNTQPTGVSYNLGNIGAGNAIAAAASQAIAATQQVRITFIWFVIFSE